MEIAEHHKDACISATIVAAAHSAQWQDVELTFCQPTQHKTGARERKKLRMRHLNPQCTVILFLIQRHVFILQPRNFTNNSYISSP